jgi:hypothetical protein
MMVFTPQRRADGATLTEHVHANTSDILNAKGNIQFAHRLEALLLRVREERIHQTLTDVGGQLRHIQSGHPPVDTEHRGRA